MLAAELDLDRILERIPESLQVEPVPVYPEVREDLALIVSESTPAASVEAALLKAGRPLLCLPSNSSTSSEARQSAKARRASPTTSRFARRTAPCATAT